VSSRITERYKHNSGDVDHLAVDLKDSSGGLHLSFKSMRGSSEHLKDNKGPNETISVRSERRKGEGWTNHKGSSELEDEVLSLKNGGDVHRNLWEKSDECEDQPAVHRSSTSSNPDAL
jgi:hypothetical protein